jgi:hypothetical protein
MFTVDGTDFPSGTTEAEMHINVFRRRLLLTSSLLVALVLVFPLTSNAYMPPPHPCELEPMTYSPPQPPTCAGPPPPAICGTCPPYRQYPRKLVGPPPCQIMVCKTIPPNIADFRIPPPPPCAPPPCGPAPCGPGLPPY